MATWYATSTLQRLPKALAIDDDGSNDWLQGFSRSSLTGPQDARDYYLNGVSLHPVRGMRSVALSLSASSYSDFTLSSGVDTEGGYSCDAGPHLQ